MAVSSLSPIHPPRHRHRAACALYDKIIAAGPRNDPADPFRRVVLVYEPIADTHIGSIAGDGGLSPCLATLQVGTDAETVMITLYVGVRNAHEHGTCPRCAVGCKGLTMIRFPPFLQARHGGKIVQRGGPGAGVGQAYKRKTRNEVNKASLREDVGALLRARHLVVSRSSFPLMLAQLSTRLERLHIPVQVARFPNPGDTHLYGWNGDCAAHVEVAVYPIPEMWDPLFHPGLVNYSAWMAASDVAEIPAPMWQCRSQHL